LVEPSVGASHANYILGDFELFRRFIKISLLVRSNSTSTKYYSRKDYPSRQRHRAPVVQGYSKLLYLNKKGCSFSTLRVNSLGYKREDYLHCEHNRRKWLVFERSKDGDQWRELETRSMT
jgi:hypothetical protein